MTNVSVIIAENVLPGMSILTSNKFSGQGVYAEVEYVWFRNSDGTTHIQTVNGRTLMFLNEENVEVKNFAYGVPDDADDVSYAEWLASWDADVEFSDEEMDYKFI